MSWRTVQALKFVRPQPELHRDTTTATILGPQQVGWTAQVDEELGVMVVKVRKQVDGKLVQKSKRFPLSSIDNYEVTAAATRTDDEPPDVK